MPTVHEIVEYMEQPATSGGCLARRCQWGLFLERVQGAQEMQSGYMEAAERAAEDLQHLQAVSTKIRLRKTVPH
eukprot:8552796-Lingulodinium_polyedra.AAC.1